MYGMTMPILTISPMYNVMEMKQTLQTVIMTFYPIRIVVIIIIIIIMVQLLYFAKSVSVLELTS